MPTERVPGTELEYFLIAYDKAGQERREPDGKLLSEQVVQTLGANAFTDVFLFAHGWKGDIPAAKEQYDRWIKAVAGRTDDIAALKAAKPNFRALLIGLHWPSLPWGDEALGVATSFVAPAFSISADDTPAPITAEQQVEKWVAEYADRIADSAAAKDALRTIFKTSLKEIAPAKLPDEVVKAYRVLDKEAGIDSGKEGAAPGHDREPFDPEGAYQRSQETPLSFDNAILGGILSPLRQLSFWKMKDRARAFGGSGGTDLLRRLQAKAAPTVRFHLMGHSFGCIAVSAILTGQDGQGAPARPVDTLALVQGALSLWSYCSSIPSVPAQAGFFRALLGKDAVRGVMFSTQSVHDNALGQFYPMGAGVAGQVVFDAPAELPKYGAVGTFGIQGPDCNPVRVKMAGLNAKNGFVPKKVYNLESSQFIIGGSGFSGAHSEIDKPEVAHAFWEAVTCASA